MWLNLQILLVLLLIQFINLQKFAEDKNTCRVSIQSNFSWYFENANAERVMQATIAWQVGDPVRYINIWYQTAKLVQYTFYKMCKSIRCNLVNVVHSKKSC